VNPEKDNIKLDERNRVEKPLLDQLAGLDWEIIDLDSKQHPSDSLHRKYLDLSVKCYSLCDVDRLYRL
jgi:type I restriction enzyme R subunit